MLFLNKKNVVSSCYLTEYKNTPGFSAGGGDSNQKGTEVVPLHRNRGQFLPGRKHDMYDVKWRDTNASGEGASGVDAMF